MSPPSTGRRLCLSGALHLPIAAALLPGRAAGAAPAPAPRLVPPEQALRVYWEQGSTLYRDIAVRSEFAGDAGDTERYVLTLAPVGAVILPPVDVPELRVNRRGPSLVRGQPVATIMMALGGGATLAEARRDFDRYKAILRALPGARVRSDEPEQLQVWNGSKTDRRLMIIDLSRDPYDHFPKQHRYPLSLSMSWNESLPGVDDEGR